MHQNCPICAKDVVTNHRYPRAVCGECAGQATDSLGRKVAYYNTELSGGIRGEYAENGDDYASVRCYIHGISCRAEEAHLGGIVIQITDEE